MTKNSFTKFGVFYKEITEVNVDILGRRLTLFKIYSANDDEASEFQGKFFQDLIKTLDYIDE